ncbi:unnamed protein product [Agarophyton chilense]
MLGPTSPFAPARPHMAFSSAFLTSASKARLPPAHHPKQRKCPTSLLLPTFPRNARHYRVISPSVRAPSTRIACDVSRRSPRSSQPSLPSTTSHRLSSTLQTLTNLFPLWVSVGAVVAFLRPATFLWFQSSYIIPTLSLIMLGMGLTITPQSFATVFRTPRQVLLGACAQYTLMPLLARVLSFTLRLPPALAAGVILVGVCPGGAASNIICLLARANVALSVVLTLVSTLLSILLIPSLMSILAGTLVPVAPFPLLISTVQVVLLPLLLGYILQTTFPRVVSATSDFLPLVSVLGVTATCCGVIAANASALATVGPKLFLTIATMHILGGILGYFVASIFRLDTSSRRTVSIEVMMQNSTLAVSLANAHFAHPATVLPGALSAVMHSVFGSVLAGIWRFTSSTDALQFKEKKPATNESLYRELDE